MHTVAFNLSNMGEKKMIGEYSEDHLVSVAKEVVEKKTANTVVLDTKAEARIPKFEISGTCTGVLARDLGFNLI